MNLKNDVASKSVFLSYASQDVDAARRICEALHGAGLEVWFDESELRGGDASGERVARLFRLGCAVTWFVLAGTAWAQVDLLRDIELRAGTARWSCRDAEMGGGR